jgi:hypothetical protein
MKKLLIVTLVAITSYGTVSAQQPAVVVSDKPGWHKIAETTADFKKEKDEVAVMISDRFSHLKFKVTDAAIDIISAVIHYEAGDSQVVIIKSPIIAPAETREIDLKGGAERSIKRISFVYKTLPNRKDEKAHVEIWGLKTNAVKN